MGMLAGKVAVVYGAGGAVGSAVTRAFKEEGAITHAVGREVDATDEQAVGAHLRDVVRLAGSVDISVNLIAVDHVQGQRLIDMTVDDFARGLEVRLRSHFITARAAARQMVGQGSGAILMLTAAPDRTSIPGVGSFGVQCAAVESFVRTLAVEVGPSGVRVACVRSAGSPDSAGVDEVFAMHAANGGVGRPEFDRSKAAGTLLGRMPRLHEVAQTMVFLASDRASAITGAITNVTCGELID